MSALSAASRNERTQAEEASTTGAHARARARTNHRLLVNGLRIAFAVVVLGFWELGSIFIITIGYNIWSKVALAVVLVFFVVFFNAFQGVREVDRVLIANARILGASERQLSTHVIFPSALSWILASLHTSFGFALVGAVVGEYLGAIHGIGLVISTAQATFNPNGVFAAMFILAVVALTAEVVLTWLENRLIRWRPNAITEVHI